MKIIDKFDLITLSIILIGLPILFYIKINEQDDYTYNIVIYGKPIDTRILAFYIDQEISKEIRSTDNMKFNITIVSSTKSSNVRDENYQKAYHLEKQIIGFCGVEKEWMSFVQNSNFKYQIKEYGVYFGEIIQNSDKNQFKTYSTQASLVNSLNQYGLSNFAAQNYFTKFAQILNGSKKSSKNYCGLEQLTTTHIIKNSLPQSIEQNSLKYFSQKLGLDYSYINRFISPIIWGNYMHEANLLSTMFKLLPVYCQKKSSIGNSLVLYEHPQNIYTKLEKMMKVLKPTQISHKQLETYSITKEKHQNIERKYVNIIFTEDHSEVGHQNKTNANATKRTYIKSDILFILQDSDLNLTKNYPYYKTIIDGKLKDDHLYEQFFTIYLRNSLRKKQQSNILKKDKAQGKVNSKGVTNIVYSISRTCAYNCKGYENSVYILISKHKLNNKHLDMFESHNIIYFKKMLVRKSHMPSNTKLQENDNVYKIYDSSGISDSYEIQFRIGKEIARSFVKKLTLKYNI